MNNCLNCGKEIVQKNGGKERKFCDNNNACKQAYHNAHKKPQKYVLKETYDKLLAKIAENNKPENKAEIEAKRNGVASNTKKEYKQPLTMQEMTDKPIRSNFKESLDYSIALAEWKEKQKA